MARTRKHNKNFGGVKNLKYNIVSIKFNGQKTSSATLPISGISKKTKTVKLSKADKRNDIYTELGRKYISKLEEYKKSSSVDILQMFKVDKALEFIRAYHSREYTENSKIERKIKLLGEVANYKQFYLLEIFGDNQSMKKLITNHCSELARWKKQSQSQSQSKEDICRNYISLCITPQAKVTAKISNQGLKDYYEMLTTPLYVKTVESPPTTKVLDEFIKYVDTGQTNWREAICNVFVDDLSMMLNIHLGVWRQLFNDGHQLMETLSLPRTIETCGRNNAEQLPRDGQSYLCPACLEKIGRENTRRREGGFMKEGKKSAVDHIDPVKHAYITYSDEGLCSQLAMTCGACNGVKSDMSIQEFLFKIFHEKNAVYLFDNTTAPDLNPQLAKSRASWYKTIHKDTIEKGVNSYETMLKRAHTLKYTYETITNFKENLIKQALGLDELVDTIPALFDLHSSAKLNSQQLYEMFSSLVIICVGDIELSYEFPHDPSELPNPTDSFINMIRNSTDTYDERGITREVLMKFFEFMAHRPTITITKYNYKRYSKILAIFLFQYLRIEGEFISLDLFKTLCNYIIITNNELVAYQQEQYNDILEGDPSINYNQGLIFGLSSIAEGKKKKQKIYKSRSRKSIK